MDKELNYTERDFIVAAIRYVMGLCTEDEVWDCTYGGEMNDKMKFAQNVIDHMEES